jgi:hypothetical protein
MHVGRRQQCRMSADLELVVVDVLRVVRKYKKEGPPETTILEPGEKFPDVKARNEATPRTEWVEGPDGQMRGPWVAQYIVYLVDPIIMDRFTYPTSTIGGGICVREIVEQTKMMRRFRGANAYPVVKLADVFMVTRFGGRQRPELKVVRWIEFGSGEAKQLSTPTLSEELNDSIEF